jgi:ArsR family transcriptional regulator, arsenate/arsenite/antimonite-responsive transcriptional repressor
MNRAQVEKISKALADETRLTIFQEIAARRDISCGDIVALQEVTPATVSHHLKILVEAGLVECRKEGQFVFSRVVPETIEGYTRALASMAAGKRAAKG